MKYLPLDVKQQSINQSIFDSSDAGPKYFYQLYKLCSILCELVEIWYAALPSSGVAACVQRIRGIKGIFWPKIWQKIKNPVTNVIWVNLKSRIPNNKENMKTIQIYCITMVTDH